MLVGVHMVGGKQVQLMHLVGTVTVCVRACEREIERQRKTE